MTLDSTKNYSDVHANYDFDDNIMFMPTNIIYFAKDSSNSIQELAVSTEGFAHSRSTVGVKNHLMSFKNINGIMSQCEDSDLAAQKIDLMDYKIVYEDDMSFREFRDHKDCYFMRDLKNAVANKKFGPSWTDFVEHCSNLRSALNVTIITARGQSPATIHRGLCYLQNLGMIKHVPPLKNIFPVSYKGPELEDKYKAAASNPQTAKMAVIEDILDHMDANKAGSSFGFSDDDKKTFEYTENFIREGVKNNRWSNIEINLYFTGNKIKERKVMLVPDYSPNVA